MRIGEAANRAGVNIQTLRFYERKGLLNRPVRLPSGYRSYREDAVKTVHFIKQAQDLGFSLAEIKQLLALRNKQSRNPAAVRNIARAKIESIELKIQRLERMRDDLSAMLVNCKCRDGKSPCAIAGIS
jgi:DNA-binding transcriptional MerR regulator